MSPSSSTHTDPEISLRHAALIGGIGLLVMLFAAPFAESVVYPKLVISGDIELTVQNMAAMQGLFLAGIFSYLATFTADLLVAWAFYVLLKPVNRSLSLLTAWFRLVYTVIAFMAFLKLVTVYRIVNTPEYVAAFGADQLHANVDLLLRSFRYEWSMGLILFAAHLGLLGYLVYRSDYIPRAVGVLLIIAGIGWLVYELGPYLYPDANLDFIMITFFGEPVFMVWLLARGWKIRGPAT